MTKAYTRRRRGSRKEVRVLIHISRCRAGERSSDSTSSRRPSMAHHSRFVREQECHDERMRETWTSNQRLPSRQDSRAMRATAPSLTDLGAVHQTVTRPLDDREEVMVRGTGG